LEKPPNFLENSGPEEFSRKLLADYADGLVVADNDEMFITA
jgi:hypothetical protein